MSPTILVVEDEPAILELLKVNLVDAGYDVREAADAETAQRAIRDELPDLLLLDWMLPGQSGLALARQLRGEARTRDLPIIMVARRRGGQGDGTGSVGRRLRHEAVQPARAEVGPLRLDPIAHRVTVSGREAALGPTEFRLLRFLMARPHRVHSRAQLLDMVWGDHVYIEERTVDVHVRRLRVALEPYGADKLIETVRGSGYRLVARHANA
jgi:two-component system, OmpR family, phosphate regulon response regulator PhoB